MTIQFTIVGLGQIGASVGLALGQRRSDIRRVGHDKDPETAKKAQQKGAVDEVKFNLPAAVREADFVLLSLPVSEVRATLEVMAPDLRPGAVVLGMSPVQEAVAGWARDLLPEGRSFVALAPAINPLYLHDTELGLEAAQEDLFANSIVMLSSLPSVSEQAVKAATDLIELLGATPLFGDLPETDGLIASTHLVPQLVAAAFLNALVDQPGWREARMLAGRPFAALTSALAYNDEVDSLAEAALVNGENVARVLDVTIRSLQGLRDDITADNREDVLERLELALEGRQRWLAERLRADWQNESEPIDMQNLPSIWERLMGSRGRSKKK